MFIYAFEEKIPDFVLEEGELRAQGKMPVTIESPGSLIIIDTSGKTGENVLDGYPNGIYISKHIMVQKTLFDKRVIDFSQLQQLKLTKDMLLSWLPYLRFTAIAVLLFVPVTFVVARFLTALLMSLVGLIFNTSMHMNLNFGELFSLSTYSLTLPILLVSVLKAGAIHIPAFWLIYFAIGSIYLWKAMNTIKNSDQPPELTG